MMSITGPQSGSVTDAITTLTLTTTEPWRFNDYTQRVTVGVMLIFIGLLGLLGNAIVILAFILSERLQNITNIFVINLAISDFLSCAIVPFFVQNTLTKIDGEPLPSPLCAFVGISLYVFVSSSIVNHAVIAFNRFYSITRPVSAYRKLFSPFKIALMLFFIWTYSSVIPFVAHFTNITEFGYNTKYRICSLDIVSMNAMIVSIIRTMFVDIVCLVIVIIFYFKIFLYVKKHSNQLMHMYSTERKGRDRISETSTSSSSAMRSYQRERKASTLTRIVDVDELDVETVINRNAQHVPVWKEVNRSVSQSNITPVRIHGVPYSIPEEENEDKADEGLDISESESDTIPGDDSECGDSKLPVNERDEDIKRNGIPVKSDSPENSPDADERPPVNDTSLRNSQNDEKCNGFGTGITNNNGSAIQNVGEDNPNLDWSSASDSPASNSPASNSPTNSPRARIPKISTLVRRSFFGRNSSINSTSERVRCMQVRLNRRQIQITKNLFVVVVAYVICVTQYGVFLIVDSFERLLPYSAVLITLGHAINPMIYAMKHPTFKIVIWPMLSCKLSKIPSPSRILKILLRK